MERPKYDDFYKGITTEDRVDQLHSMIVAQDKYIDYLMESAACYMMGNVVHDLEPIEDKLIGKHKF